MRVYASVLSYLCSCITLHIYKSCIILCLANYHWMSTSFFGTQPEIVAYVIDKGTAYVTQVRAL